MGQILIPVGQPGQPMCKFWVNMQNDAKLYCTLSLCAVMIAKAQYYMTTVPVLSASVTFQTHILCPTDLFAQKIEDSHPGLPS